ncbi:MAG: hypothetical protein GX595_08610 [Lentisphaerae bacterium]|jgi:hypothetical protein|nr:hypothetical protein [Lentisphaerota bacterium]
MITGEFLVCDDLGPLGRLVPPGELFVMEPRDVNLVIAERKWISGKYLEADEKAEQYRKRLKTAHLRGRRDAIREWFDIWTIEAAKYSVCDGWLLAVVGLLEMGKQQAMNVPKNFSYNGYGPIRELTKKVVNATDEEIINGARFRVS